MATTSDTGLPAPPVRAFGGCGVWLAAVAVAAVTAWLALTGTRALRSSHQLGRAVWVDQGRMVGPVLLAVVATLFLVERRWPAVPRAAWSRGHLVDAAYLLLFVVIGPVLTVLNTGFAIEVERHAPWMMLGRLPLVPQLVVVAVIVVGMDGANWLAHVGNHRLMALWRFHALHHSQEDMSVLTTFRTHPLAHASYLLAAVPALVLEASGTVPAATVIAYGCLVSLPHANLRWTFGPLGRFVVSPAYHRLHHAREAIDGHQTVNFGFVLVCWDRLAHCATFPSGGEPVPTGIGGRPVPTEQHASGAGVARVFGAQLWQPFRRPTSSGSQPTSLERTS